MRTIAQTCVEQSNDAHLWNVRDARMGLAIGARFGRAQGAHDCHSYYEGKRAARPSLVGARTRRTLVAGCAAT